MGKPRANSLYARLSPKQRDQVLHWLIIEGKSLEWVQKQIQANCGIECSIMAVSRFLSSHGLEWRMDRAAEAAEAAARTAPKDIEAKIRSGLKQAEFARVFEEMTVKELVAMKRVKIAEDRIELDRRRLAILEAREEKTRETLTDSKLSAAEKEARIKGIFGIK